MTTVIEQFFDVANADFLLLQMQISCARKCQIQLAFSLRGVLVPFFKQNAIFGVRQENKNPTDRRILKCM
ncbi:MAG: hypothetical protein RSB59_02855 [Clostridia bacterium]